MNPILDAPVTAEQKLEYAGFWIRFVAYVIDIIVLTIVIGILALTFGVAAVMAESFGLLIAIYLVFFVLVYAYFSIMESSEKQATLGKMAVGIKVGDMNGNRITTMNALGRALGKILSGMILYIGYIMVGFDSKKQGLHDKLANTVVYYAR